MEVLWPQTYPKGSLFAIAIVPLANEVRKHV